MIENIIYLEVEDVEEIHDMLLERDGGLAGREPGKLESKLALPMSGFGDFERYPTLAEKAAVYHYHLAGGHCFFDANKRTSYAAMVLFLDFNGYDLIATDLEIYEWTLILANHATRPAFKHAVEWIEEHMKPFEY